MLEIVLESLRVSECVLSNGQKKPYRNISTAPRLVQISNSEPKMVDSAVCNLLFDVFPEHGFDIPLLEFALEDQLV